MRKTGFTLAEILVALSIGLVAMITTISFGRQWWQHQQEEQFLADFQRDWEHLRQIAISNQVDVEVKWDNDHQRFIFEVDQQPGDMFVYRPEHLGMSLPEDDNYWAMGYSGKHFTTPQTLILYSTKLDEQIELTWQMGTGVLLRKIAKRV